jgi:hypothetical protein
LHTLDVFDYIAVVLNESCADERADFTLAFYVSYMAGAKQLDATG